VDECKLLNGGVIAAHYTKRYPDMVQHLILAGPAGVRHVNEEWYAALTTWQGLTLIPISAQLELTLPPSA
jgi:pimeloyl-ACP methyl ester carboxylesterase